MRRTRTCELRLTGPRTTTDLKNAKKSLKKKVVPNFLQTKKKSIFSQKMSFKLNNQNKKMSIFRDIPKKHDFFSQKTEKIAENKQNSK